MAEALKGFPGAPGRPFTTVLVAAALAATVGVALGSVASAQPAQPLAAATAGTLTHSNSRDGAAILRAESMKPGDSQTGLVTITNTGDLAGWFWLSASKLVDNPGPGGGRLSERLWLVVEDVSAAGSPARIYAGALGGLGTRPLGTIGPGEARTYRFTVSWPPGEDDPYQGSSTTVEYSWSATADEPSAEPPPPAPAAPAPPPQPAPSAPAAPVVPGPSAPVPDKTPPALTLRGPSTQRARGRALVVEAVCDEACSLRTATRVLVGGAARAARARRQKTLSLRSLTVRAAGGAPAKLSIPLSKPARATALRALARRQRVVASVTVTATDGSGNAASAQRRIALKR